MSSTDDAMDIPARTINANFELRTKYGWDEAEIEYEAYCKGGEVETAVFPDWIEFIADDVGSVVLASKLWYDRREWL